MKIAILGYGKEGKAAEEYFAAKGNEIKLYDNFTAEELKEADFSEFDLVLRSPSVKPLGNWSSMTEYFFENCPCPIIGVTGTKGKGTTCSFIKSILEALGQKTYLVGNIGVPSITVLDSLKPLDAVVYEMSSFQLWDIKCSPHVAVVLGIEPDHLNVHDGFQDYTNAKANIVRFQDEEDYCIYNAKNDVSTEIAGITLGETIPYPEDKAGATDKLSEVIDYITIPGQHNRENAEAAVKAVAAFFDMDVEEFLDQYFYAVAEGIANFTGLPHRLEFLRELNGVRYYDDNFSTNPASTRTAMVAFPDSPIVAIIGGRDKTDDEDLPEIYQILSAENIKKIILMGESGHALAEKYTDERFVVVESLDEAVTTARIEAEKLPNSVVVMSPSAASFDMFENVYDRGAQFAKKIAELQ